MKSVKKVISYCCEIAKKIPFWIVIVIEIVSAGLSLLYTATDLLKAVPVSIAYMIYVVAGCGLCLFVWRMILFFEDAQWKEKLRKMIHRWSFLGKMADDFSYRTVTMAGISFVMNMLFAVSKGVVGWISTSFWMITFAAYYMVLCLSKLILLGTRFKLRKIDNKKMREIKEWKAYRFCGILLMMLTIVLQGMVVLIMKTGSQFTYHEILLLLIATVDFYSLIVSIVYMIRNRGIHTPIIAAIKNISFASSLVSILSLQTAMFASYGADMDLQQKKVMNLLTGSAVCILILAFGGYMIWNARKNLKRLDGKPAL